MAYDVSCYNLAIKFLDADILGGPYTEADKAKLAQAIQDEIERFLDAVKEARAS